MKGTPREMRRRAALALAVALLASESVLLPPADGQLMVLMPALGLGRLFRNIRVMVALGAVTRRFRRNRRLLNLLVAPMLLRRDDLAAPDGAAPAKPSGDLRCLSQLVCDLSRRGAQQYDRDSDERLIIELMDSLSEGPVDDAQPDRRPSAGTRTKRSCRSHSCPYSSSQIMGAYRRQPEQAASGRGPMLTLTVTS